MFKRVDGEMMVEETENKITCRIQLEKDPSEYEDGYILKIKVNKTDKLPKGIDINA